MKGSKESLRRLYDHLLLAARLRDELLDREVFYSLKEARVLVERWRQEYNQQRLHSSFGYKTPAQFEAECIDSAEATPSPRQYTIENVDNSLINPMWYINRGQIICCYAGNRRDGNM